MEMKWTEELIDQIAIRATQTMHQEFDDMEESHLKEIYPAIVPGIVRHVLEVAEKIRSVTEQVGLADWQKTLLNNAEYRGSFDLMPNNRLHATPGSAAQIQMYN